MSKMSRIAFAGAVLMASFTLTVYAQVAPVVASSGEGNVVNLTAFQAALDRVRSSCSSSDLAVMRLGEKLQKLRAQSGESTPEMSALITPIYSGRQPEIAHTTVFQLSAVKDEVQSLGVYTSEFDAKAGDNSIPMQLAQAAPVTPSTPAENKPTETPTTSVPAAPVPATDSAATPATPAPPAGAATAPAPVPATAEQLPPPGKRAKDTSKAGLPTVTRMTQGTKDGATAGKGGISAPSKTPAPTETIVGDPMNQVVSLDFREMELANVVQLLAQKAGINVIAGTDLKGVVTSNIRNVTLRRAMDTVLRQNGLGMVEEEGIYRIVPYQEALATKRKSLLVKLESAKASELKKTLDEVNKGSVDEIVPTISTNESTNVLILSGSEKNVAEMEKLAKQLDVAKPMTPTVTEAIRLNNAKTEDFVAVVKGMLTPEIGKVTAEERSRTLVVTDVPVVMEQVRMLVKEMDTPVKQVCIDAMIVDATLANNADTGVDWVARAVAHKNLAHPSQTVGSLKDLGFEQGINTLLNPVNNLTFGIVTNNIDIKGAIASQVADNNAKLLANPVVVTVENKKATMDISKEIPYTEYRQSTTGPSMSSTAFKNVGIVLNVTPNVSADNYVISDIDVKKSDAPTNFNNIPVEEKRQTQTTLRTKNGETIFIGGLRSSGTSNTTGKTPVLGDIPVVNALFKHSSITHSTTELLVFLTGTILPADVPELSPELKAASEEIETTSRIPEGAKMLKDSILHPKRQTEDKNWKWRRSAQ